MRRLAKNIIDLRQGETSRTFLMFIYLFLTIASLLIVKPVRNSLFISHFGSSQLPYAYIYVALVSVITALILSRLTSRLSPDRLITKTILVFSVTFFLFWILLIQQTVFSPVYYLFYIWVAIFGVTTAAQFWLFANYVFNTRQAKRLFGFIGIGGILGGMFGGYATKFLAPITGSANLILISIVLMLITTWIVPKIWRDGARQSYGDSQLSERLMYRRSKTNPSVINPVKLLVKSRYLTLIALIVIIGVVTSNLVDYQFSSIASAAISDADELSAFFGMWLSNMSLLSLVLQIVVTGFVLKKIGVGTSLMFQPVGILLSSLALFFVPPLGGAVTLKLADGSLKQSAGRVGLEMLMLPVPSFIKNRIKNFIDIFVDSFATGIGGLLLLYFATFESVSYRYISYLILGLTLLWVILVLLIRKEYVNAFRTAIEKRTLDFSRNDFNFADPKLQDSIISVFQGGNDRQILYVLQLIENVDDELIRSWIPVLLKHPAPAIQAQTLRIARHNKIPLTDLKNLILSGSQPVRQQAIRYLCSTSTNGKAKAIELLNDENPQIQAAALICLAKESLRSQSASDKLEIKSLIDELFEKNNLSLQSNHQLKVAIAEFIGITQNSELQQYLKVMFSDSSPIVVNAAIKAAGQCKIDDLIPDLIQFLSKRYYRKTAREAITSYGGDVLMILDQVLSDKLVNRDICLEIPGIFTNIGLQDSVDILLNHLSTVDIQLKYKIIKSLNKLRNSFQGLVINRKLIHEHIISEVHNYYIISCIILQHTLSLSQKSTGKTASLLYKALCERLDYLTERIFRLLGLIYPPGDVYNAYRSIISKNQHLRAAAIEFLDNVVSPDLKNLIIPIAENSPPEIIAMSLSVYFPSTHIKQTNYLSYLIECQDSWLKSCALFVHTQSGNSLDQEILNALAQDHDPVVNDTVQYCLNHVSRI